MDSLGKKLLDSVFSYDYCIYLSCYDEKVNVTDIYVPCHRAVLISHSTFFQAFCEENNYMSCHLVLENEHAMKDFMRLIQFVYTKDSRLVTPDSKDNMLKFAAKLKFIDEFYMIHNGKNVDNNNNDYSTYENHLDSIVSFSNTDEFPLDLVKVNEHESYKKVKTNKKYVTTPKKYGLRRRYRTRSRVSYVKLC